MPPGNSSSAYATVRPIGISLVDQMTEQENQDFKYRKEQRDIDEIEQKKKDKEQADKEALWDKYVKPLSNYDTGSSSLNEAQGMLLSHATEQYVPLLNILNDKKATESDKVKARLKLDAINKLPENMATMTKALTDRDLEYWKNKEAGNIFENPEYEKNYREGYANKLLTLDENGMPMIAFRDIDGDGKNDIETYSQIQSVVGKYDFQPKVDLDKIAVRLAKDVGVDDVTTDKNFTQRQTKQANADKLKTVIKGALYDPQGQPTPAMLSGLRMAGLENDPKNYARIEDELFSKTFALTDKTDLTNKDYGAMNAAQRLAFDKSKADEEKEPKISTGQPVEPTKGTWGQQYDKIDTKTRRSVPVVGGAKLPAINIKTGTVNGKPVYENVTDATLENYTYDKNGNLLIDVSFGEDKTTTTEATETNGKTSTKTATKGKQQIQVTKETEARIAKQLSLTIEEMRAKTQRSQGDETAQERAIRIANGG